MDADVPVPLPPRERAAAVSVPARPRPFRRAVLRGMALVLPPVLTIVVLLWVANTVQMYVLRPVTVGAREVLIWWVWDVPEFSVGRQEVQDRGQTYERLDSGEYVP